MIAGEKIQTHRKTRAPHCCECCGYIWYGICVKPSNRVLCGKCYSAFYDYFYEQYGELPQNEKDTIVNGWITRNTRQRVHRYHVSVPRWIRLAIDAGVITFPSNHWYVIKTVRKGKDMLLYGVAIL